MPARSSLSISSAWQASSSGKLRRLRTSERILKEKRCSMSSLISFPPHQHFTYSFLSFDMPRKAPEVIVDSGFALMSRICMLRGSSVSFIQRRRLLVMELWNSNNSKLNIKVCICKIREQLRLFVSQRCNLLKSATCKVHSAAAVESPESWVPSRESKVDRRVGRLPTARNVTTVSHKISFYFWAHILLSSLGFSWPAIAGSVHTVNNGA